MALFVISAAAFSQRPPWNDDEPESIPIGHTLPFRSALHGVLENVFHKMLLPEVYPFYLAQSLRPDSLLQVAYRLPSKRLHHINLSFRELEVYLRRMIQDRRQSGFDARESDEGRHDLLGSLVYANNAITEAQETVSPHDLPSPDEGKKNSAFLTDSEVMGNIYVFLLAGHGKRAAWLTVRVLSLSARYHGSHLGVYVCPAGALSRDTKKIIRAY